MEIKGRIEAFRQKLVTKYMINKIKKFEKKNDYKSIVKLMESCQGTNIYVNHQCVNALVSIGPQCLSFLFEIIDQPEEYNYYTELRLLDAAVNIGGILPELLERLPKWIAKGNDVQSDIYEIYINYSINAIGDYKDKSTLPILLKYLELDAFYLRPLLKAIQKIGVSSVTETILNFGLKVHLTSVWPYRYPENYRYREIMSDITNIDSECMDLVVSMLEYEDSIKTDSSRYADFLLLNNQLEELRKLDDVGVNSITKSLEYQKQFNPVKNNWNRYRRSSYWRVPDNEVRNELVKALSYYKTELVVGCLLSILNDKFNNYTIRKGSLSILKDKVDDHSDLKQFEFIDRVLLGGFNEPYCSEECYNKAGSEIFGNVQNGSSGNCGFCEETVTLFSEDRDGSIVFPYKNKSFFICSYHVVEGRTFVNNIDECCMCGNPLQT